MECQPVRTRQGRSGVILGLLLRAQTCLFLRGSADHIDELRAESLLREFSSHFLCRCVRGLMTTFSSSAQFFCQLCHGPLGNKPRIVRIIEPLHEIASVTTLRANEEKGNAQHEDVVDFAGMHDADKGIAHDHEV